MGNLLNNLYRSEKEEIKNLIAELHELYNTNKTIDNISDRHFKALKKACELLGYTHIRSNKFFINNSSILALRLVCKLKSRLI